MAPSIRLAVTGDPVDHSLSPALFTAAFAALGMAARYDLLEAGSAGEALARARARGLAGFNVTAPFKEAMRDLVIPGDAATAAVGAVNTVVLGDDGAVGWNTDPAGVTASLRDVRCSTAGKRIAVLGAGGAARAAAHVAMLDGAADVVLVGRTPERARSAASALGCRAVNGARAEAEVARADVVLSCLPPGASTPAAGALRPGQVVLDACYADPPLEAAARRAGCRYRDGRPWLLGQAAAAFARFVGRTAPIEAMQRALGSRNGR